jgi:hypothetical protein
MKTEPLHPRYGFYSFTKAHLFLWACGFLAAALAGARAEPYSFTTLAGRAGVYGSGDGTDGNAQFSSPQAVAVDSVDTIYVADNIDSTIRKVSLQGTNWTVATLAGQAGFYGFADGTNNNALFNQPSGIAVDSAGTLYVADTANHTIRKIVKSRLNWIVTTLAGSVGYAGSSDGTNGNAQFNAPNGLAVDNAGNLFVADTANNTIRKVSLMDTNWVVSTLAGLAGTNHSGSADGTNSQARFNGPSGVALDGAGNLFVSDSLNHSIRKVSPVGPNWVVTTLAGWAGSPGSADGTNRSARFNYPVGIAVDTATNFYVADRDNNCLRKGAPAGTNWVVSTIGGLAGVANYGSRDGVGSAARFLKPQGVTADKSGNIYVADTFNATIRGGKPAILVHIALSGSSVLLSWPLMASNYVLESATTVKAGATWTPQTSGVVSNASGYSLTKPISGPAAFFRLRQ